MVRVVGQRRLHGSNFRCPPALPEGSAMQRAQLECSWLWAENEGPMSRSGPSLHGTRGLNYAGSANRNFAYGVISICVGKCFMWLCKTITTTKATAPRDVRRGTQRKYTLCTGHPHEHRNRDHRLKGLCLWSKLSRRGPRF